MDAEAEGSREHQGTRWLKRGLLVVAGFLLFNVGASVVFEQFERTMHAYGIASSAMEPTLHCARPAAGCEEDTSDRVFVLRFHPFWTPSRDEIVAFKTTPAAVRKCGAGGTFVKRIVALPGETVELRLIRRREYVYIDGRELEEHYVEPDRRAFGPERTYKVPQGQYFLLGDNRASSCDSRAFGPVGPHESRRPDGRVLTGRLIGSACNERTRR